MRAALASILLAAATLAQSAPTKLPPWRIDPYTKNDPKLMALLGYVSYGPFPYGQKGSKACTSEDVDRHLSYEQIRWVETAHFKIGSMLPEFPLPEEVDTKKKIRTELDAIAKKFGKAWTPKPIVPTTRLLDPWLRLHLVAHRMEELYKQFQDLTGVTDADFPLDPSQVVRGKGEYMGQGPYLGMTKKYEILIFDRTSAFNDFLKNFIGRVTKYEQRWHHKEIGALWFGLPTDDPDKKHDTGMHQCLAHNIAHNMLDGFRHYSYDLPVWLTEGFAHWMERRVDPKRMNFCQNEASTADMSNDNKWRAKARNLVDQGKGSVFSESFTWRDYSQINFNDHVLLWARIDFLMSFGKDKFATFLRKVKGRVDANWLANQENLVGACRDALNEVYGLSVLSFDDKFKVWVQKNYPVQEEGG